MFSGFSRVQRRVDQIVIEFCNCLSLGFFVSCFLGRRFFVFLIPGNT